MRRRVVLLPVVLLLVIPAGGVWSQELPPLDLTITDIRVTCFPDETMLLEAETGLATRDAVPLIYTTVSFYVNGEPVGDVVYDVSPQGISDCFHSVYPDCSGWCEPAEINGVWTQGFCAGLRLPDPTGPICVCVYLYWKHTFAEGGGDPMVVGAGIDGGHPLLAGQGAVDEGLVEEWNEENNYFEIAIGPSAVEGRTWSSLKSMWR